MLEKPSERDSDANMEVLVLTLNELSQLYYLKAEMEADQRRLNKLRAEREDEEERLMEMRSRLDGIESANLDGMPHGSPDQCGKVERSVISMLDLEERIQKKRSEILQLETMISQRQTLCLMERARLENYISAISDSITRQIFMARFIDGMTWEAVANAVGSNTVDSVKKTCYRYIRSNKG